MKKILRFLLILLPWFIGSIIFKTDSSFYKNINKPFFAPPGFLFGIIWPILFILIAISIYKIFEKYNIKDTNNYNNALIINYFANQLFSFTFFIIKSPFIALIDTIIVLISSILLYIEAKELDENASKFLIPYIVWNIFATILILSILFLNL